MIKALGNLQSIEGREHIQSTWIRQYKLHGTLKAGFMEEADFK